MKLKKPLAAKVNAIEAKSKELGFVANCDLEVANLCAVLARGVGGDWLELGTGTGLSTLFLAEVMSDGRLDTVDNDEAVSAVAKQEIGADRNISFIVEDGGKFLKSCRPETYRFIFADAWPGKFSHLNYALEALELGGLYVIDDLLPQDNWPPAHQPRVDALLALFQQAENFAISYLDWASGVAIVTKLDGGGIAAPLVDQSDFAFLVSDDMPNF